ncbi:sensor histidine kinase [Tengunoibacter tsumagoiensis]|uniref:histidine kinase n=1 Tax=Tengunoibacter tsumagoiensis TaxID=2014871 RepID=A0A402A1I5_9CHLR|nr:ATP-binding protein [Tengunoibacter tsumagoiensis]GCE12909.1 two-component sensor histidine kinase [Tengunoibacter tsumagoiensis]
MKRIIFRSYLLFSGAGLLFCFFMIGTHPTNVSFYAPAGLIMACTILLFCVIQGIRKVRTEGVQGLRRFWHSMRLRLTLWYVALLALILVTFSSIIYTTESVNLSTTLDSYLRTRLTQVAVTYDAQKHQIPLTDVQVSIQGSDAKMAPTESTKGEADQPIRKLIRNDEFVVLMNPEGQILQSSIVFTSQDIKALTAVALPDVSVRGDWKNSTWITLGSPPLTLHVRNAELSLSTLKNQFYETSQALIVDNQQHVSAILLVGTPSTIEAELHSLLLILEITTPLVLLLSSLGGYWLADRAMKPVQVITRTAQQIGETDLHRRLKLRQRGELGELADTFDHMLQRLEEAFDRQRQFTADASHELRTPLSIIDLEATRALQHDMSPEQYQRTMTVILQENRHMSHLVNDLLLLARADTGQSRFQQEQLDLSDVLCDTIERLAPLAEQTGIAIQILSLPELSIHGDYLYLQQLCTNIIENALKYSAGIGDNVTITVTRQRYAEQDWAVLRITDNGPGIAAEHLLHLFERFYRVDQSRTHNQKQTVSGNGLGLSIAQLIVQAHGGAIQVHSVVGQGSTFEIRLPV